MSNVKIGWERTRPLTKLLCRDQFELRWGTGITASIVAAVVTQLHDNTALRLTDAQRIALYNLKGYVLGRSPALGLTPVFPGHATQATEPSEPALLEIWPEPISVWLLDYDRNAPPPNMHPWRVYSKDHTTLVHKEYTREPGGTHAWVDEYRAVRYCPHSVRTRDKVFPGDVLDQANLVLDYLTSGLHLSRNWGTGELPACAAVLEHIRTTAWTALIKGTKAGAPKTSSYGILHGECISGLQLWTTEWADDD